MHIPRIPLLRVPRALARTGYRRTSRITRILISLFLIAPLVLPVNFVLINPGEGNPLFPKMLKVNSVKTYPVDGQMFLLSIWVTNPQTLVLGFQVLHCWIKPTCVVTPRSVIYPKVTDDKAELAEGAKEMKQSQNSAIVATKKLFAKKYPELNLAELTDASLKVSLKNTGGPSGGLIFSLGLVELLAPENLLQGRKIAATGTISKSGAVGAIGGVQEKIVAARAAGVELLFISRKNCDEISGEVDGLKVIAVSTLEEAYLALKGGGNSDFRGVQGCTNLSA
ncbi:Lon-like protease [Candidatus Planktophila versatilis]|uniref:Lon-like protease n=1 Tax=Candidatus Planktophila versatilis TaxID=1884905 RepID=A0ABM6MD39_9ACTN|nr:Lon-like protease [Candidatus Planktophila versatilis]